MAREFRVTGAQHGAAFAVRVIANARCAEIAGMQDDGSLRIRLAGAVTEDVNAELIAFVAGVLQLDPAHVAVVAGADRPNKIIGVEGVSPAWVEERLIANR